MKKIIAIILIFILSFSSLGFKHVKGADKGEIYYEDGYYPIFYNENNKEIFESLEAYLPTNTPKTISINGNVFPFNYRLWFSKNIVVYGDYQTANPRANDFKGETDSPHNIGYYSKNGVRGEYRYHGFDIAGNRYNNTWWTIDVDTGSSINDNEWLYQPWNEITYNLERISPYNEAAEQLYDPEDYKTRAWINRPIEKDGEVLTFENAEIAGEREAYRYIHIMSPPTINYPGEGKGWHRYNNQFLYRTFTIDKLEYTDKSMTDLSTEVRILTPLEQLTVYDFGTGKTGNTAEYLEEEIEVMVEVTGTLLDEDYYNDPVKKTVRYTREDIKDWDISLGSSIQKNIKSANYNKGKAVFTLRYKVASILTQSTYALNGHTVVNFINDKNNEGWSSTDLVFNVERKSPPTSILKDKLMTGVDALLEVLEPSEMLTIIDYRENNTEDYLDGVVTVSVKITGMLLDDSFYNNPQEKDSRYNRDDIHSWAIGLKDEVYNGIEGDSSHKNICDGVVVLKFSRKSIMEQQTWHLTGYAEALFLDGEKSKGITTGDLVFTIQQATQNSEPPPEPPPDTIEEPLPPPIIVEPDCKIPYPGFDIIPFPAYDDTDLTFVLSRRVYINGAEIDDIEFFSGDYIFGDEKDGIKKIDVTYESIDGITTSTTQWTYIFSTRPVAQFKLEGTFKENRKLTATENCEVGNTQIVLEEFPIVAYEWQFITIDGGTNTFRQRTPSSDKHREFLYKEPGVYRLELTVTNSLGRSSKVYGLDFVIYEDTPPAIEMNIWNGVLTRGEDLKLHYSTSSVDKDTIAIKTLKLYYDNNNDGTCSRLERIFEGGEFTGFTPDKLGKYRLVAEAIEEFGQETLPEFITAADKKYKIIEREFWVDNLVPMTDIYINTPVVKPEIDLYIMMDKDLNEAKKQYITGNRINFNNFLRKKNILSNILTWDMKTYQYSQSVSDTRYTGESYPPSCISYTSGGYSGILSCDRVVDNGESRDMGGYETKTQSKEFSRTHTNTIIKTYWDGELINTSETDPAPSNKYIDEDGYCGSIPKTSTNGPYNYRKFDEYTGSKEFTRYHRNTVTDYYYNGSLLESHNSNPAPDRIYISEDGYYGYIYRTGTNGPFNRTEGYVYYMGYYCWRVQQTFEAIYSGSISKIKTYKTSEDYISIYRGTLTKTVRVWVPDIRWVSDYIGFYSGTVSKNVRQPWEDPFRPTSDKYIVYISDGNINELADLETSISKADAELILVGNDTIRNQIAHDHYISKDKTIDLIMDEILDYIAINSPAVEEHYILAGIEDFEIKTMNFDEEDDPIIENKYMYIQDQHYFDNPTGMESFAVTDFSENDGWIDTKIEMFNKVGEFRIFKRIRDLPTPDPKFANYSYYSGIRELRVYAHRRPIANAVLDWNYNSSKETYETTWICYSFDPDHQFSREDKGIVDRKIMFRRAGGEWNYYVPEELPPGIYEVEYYVKDIEGVWSEPFIMNFTLPAPPEVQFDAKLRMLDSNFNLEDPRGVPASEYLEVYDAWTRHPNNIRLEMAIYNGDTRIGTLKRVNYSTSTGVKYDNDIYWNNISCQIPNTTEDGVYSFKIKAVDVKDTTKFHEKRFTVKVNTPINLEPTITGTIMRGAPLEVEAETTKYVNIVRAELFYNTPYQKNLDLVGRQVSDMKEWENRYTIPLNIPDGTYEARFTAITPSGKNETVTVYFNMDSFKVTEATIEGYWNHWRGQLDIFGDRLTDEPHRFLGLERVKINVYTDGYVDKVEIRFSPELEAMEYWDEYGNLYNYCEDFDLPYEVFPKVFLLDDSTKESHIYWEYVLPLADSTKNWDNTLQRFPYVMEVRAWKGTAYTTYEINDIEITGNVYDLTYIQPVN